MILRKMLLYIFSGGIILGAIGAICYILFLIAKMILGCCFLVETND